MKIIHLILVLCCIANIDLIAQENVGILSKSSFSLMLGQQHSVVSPMENKYKSAIGNTHLALGMMYNYRLKDNTMLEIAGVWSQKEGRRLIPDYGSVNLLRSQLDATLGLRFEEQTERVVAFSMSVFTGLSTVFSQHVEYQGNGLPNQKYDVYKGLGAVVAGTDVGMRFNVTSKTYMRTGIRLCTDVWNNNTRFSTTGFYLSFGRNYVK